MTNEAFRDTQQWTSDQGETNLHDKTMREDGMEVGMEEMRLNFYFLDFLGTLYYGAALWCT